MSTELGHLQSGLKVTRFYGGNKRGVCLQLMDENSMQHLGLSKSDIDEINEFWNTHCSSAKMESHPQADNERSTQQLRAEICAEMRDAVDNMQDGIADGLKSMVREWERKLSPVCKGDYNELAR